MCKSSFVKALFYKNKKNTSSSWRMINVDTCVIVVVDEVWIDACSNSFISNAKVNYITGYNK